MNAPDLQMILDASVAPETRLAPSEPLTLTRNFAWIVFFCVASLLTLPVVIAWTASILLN
jgi:hypothetical protein